MERTHLSFGDTDQRRACCASISLLELADFIGLDVLYAVCDSLYDEFAAPSTLRPRC